MVRKTGNKLSEAKRGEQPGPNGSMRQPGRIVCTPGVCGGNARIHGTRIPVWGLAQARKNGCSDRQILAMFPGLVRADLVAAWDYIERHREAISRQVRANEE